MRVPAKLSLDKTGKIVLEKPELKPKKYRVEIRIRNPIVIVDEYVKKPSKDNILESFHLGVQRGEFDNKITIQVEPVE